MIHINICFQLVVIIYDGSLFDTQIIHGDRSFLLVRIYLFIHKTR